jgi:hypothetical protein
LLRRGLLGRSRRLRRLLLRGGRSLTCRRLRRPTFVLIVVLLLLRPILRGGRLSHGKGAVARRGACDGRQGCERQDRGACKQKRSGTWPKANGHESDTPLESLAEFAEPNESNLCSIGSAVAASGVQCTCAHRRKGNNGGSGNWFRSAAKICAHKTRVNAPMRRVDEAVFIAARSCAPARGRCRPLRRSREAWCCRNQFQPGAVRSPPPLPRHRRPGPGNR